MAAARRFDHEEAARLYAAGGVTHADLAERYGVTDKAVQQVLARRDPERRERMNRVSREYQREHRRAPCRGGCGALIWKDNKRSGLCPACSGLAQATSVREDELRCGHCRQWKPDEEFPFYRRVKARRGRHSTCRGCQAQVRQDHRERHKVPCERCGKPTLSEAEKRAGGRTPTGLCLACYRDDIRAGRVPGFGPVQTKAAA